MVTTCSVKGCKSKAGQGIKFHKLPKGEIREAWITFLKKYNPLFMPTSHSTNVCGLHFLSDLDYEVTPTSIYQTKRLKKNAVPSIMHQNVCRLLFIKSNQKLNCVPDHDAEEEIVTLSLSDIFVNPTVPITRSSIPQNRVSCRVSPELAAPVIQKRDEIPSALVTVNNASTDSPAPVIQNINEIPSIKNTSRVSPELAAPVIQKRDEIPSALVTVNNASTDSPAPIIQNINEIPSIKNTSEESLLRFNNKRKCFMGDFKHLSDIDSPNSRLKYWIASQSTVNKQNKKIKLLYKQMAGLKKKIIHKDNLIDQLKSERKKDSNNCITVLQELILSSSQHEIYMSMCKPI